MEDWRESSEDGNKEVYTSPEGLPNWNDGILDELDSFPSDYKVEDAMDEGDEFGNALEHGRATTYQRCDVHRSRRVVEGALDEIAAMSDDVLVQSIMKEGGAVGWDGKSPLVLNRQAESSLTPSKSGVSGRAFRVSSTAKKGSHGGEDVESKRAGDIEKDEAPATKFHGILKKLEFHSRQSAVPGQSANVVGRDTLETPAAQQLKMTATKKLMFGTHSRSGTETPTTNLHGAVTGLPGTVGTTRRRVTFGGRVDGVSSRQPAIEERDESSFLASPERCCEGGIDDAMASVNSRHAGSTPFDKRLSALFTKYAPTTENEGASDIALDVVDIMYQDSSEPTSEAIEKKGDGMNLVERLAKSTPQGATVECGGDFVTREQLASALRRSLHYIEQSKKSCHFEREPMCGVISPTAGLLSKSFEGYTVYESDSKEENWKEGRWGQEVDFQSESDVSLRDALEAKENDELQSIEFQRSSGNRSRLSVENIPMDSSEFSFGQVTPVSEFGAIQAPMSGEDTPELYTTSGMLVPRSVSPSLLSLHGKAMRVPTPIEHDTEEVQDMMDELNLHGTDEGGDLCGTGPGENEGNWVPRRSPRLAQKRVDLDHHSHHAIGEIQDTPQAVQQSGLQRRYSTRSATKSEKKTRKSSPGSATSLKLSPTEQSIRDSLRRSRRKSVLSSSNHETKTL
eukprot:jgi/Picsp_1/5936/NSC_03293-R1_---NA---